MIRTALFWEAEKKAALMNLNNDFLKEGEVDEPIRVAKSWLDIVGVDVSTPSPFKEVPEDEKKTNRIFEADAVRTFSSKEYQERVIRLLETLYNEFGDYHQGLGYVSSFLNLFLEEEEVKRLCFILNTNEKYTPEFWKAAPNNYVRDARVFGRLMEISAPAVHTYLNSCAVLPEAYASKWFVGLCVHVLPFEVLMEFLTLYFTQGWQFLFQFALELVASIEEDMLALQGSIDPAAAFALLRLDGMRDEKLASVDFTREIVARAKERSVDKDQISAWREEELKLIEEKLARLKALEAEQSDDEIVFSDEEDEDEDED